MEKQIITLRMILESKFPKGSKLKSRKNTNFTKPKKKR
jgi:hypothetical protein